MKKVSDQEVGARVRALRERAGHTQRDLAAALDLKDVQSISALEKGERRLASEEMLVLAMRYRVGDAYFLDPFACRALPRFTWSATRPDPTVHDLEESVREWLAFYRELCLRGAGPLPWVLPRLPIDERSQEADCVEAGERIWVHCGRPPVPAIELASIYRALETLVLAVQSDSDIVAGAVQMGEVNAVILNSLSHPGTRNAAGAKQLFHLCTWDAIPPPHFSSSSMNRRYVAVDRLASAFARGLLLPADLVQSLNPPAFETATWISERARELGVPGVMLKTRLAEEGRLLREMVISDDLLNKADQLQVKDQLRLFGADFLRVIEIGRRQGYTTDAKVFSLLGLSGEKYRGLLRAYD